MTENTPLSTDRLPAASLTDVISWRDTLVLCGTERHFTIYEGDWGKPYAARFEVWLKPADGSRERKLYESIWQIEGWQR
ncbi:MAG: hypothetical protein JST76_02325 [Bacteroidetes bacterium]|nr:hypothetical protein [Bacteroidota bacterium]